MSHSPVSASPGRRHESFLSPGYLGAKLGDELHPTQKRVSLLDPFGINLTTTDESPYDSAARSRSSPSASLPASRRTSAVFQPRSEAPNGLRSDASSFRSEKAILRSKLSSEVVLQDPLFDTSKYAPTAEDFQKTALYKRTMKARKKVEARNSTLSKSASTPAVSDKAKKRSSLVYFQKNASAATLDTIGTEASSESRRRSRLFGSFWAFRSSPNLSEETRGEPNDGNRKTIFGTLLAEEANESFSSPTAQRNPPMSAPPYVSGHTTGSNNGRDKDRDYSNKELPHVASNNSNIRKRLSTLHEARPSMEHESLSSLRNLQEEARQRKPMLETVYSNYSTTTSSVSPNLSYTSRPSGSSLSSLPPQEVLVVDDDTIKAAPQQGRVPFIGSEGIQESSSSPSSAMMPNDESYASARSRENSGMSQEREGDMKGMLPDASGLDSAEAVYGPEHEQLLTDPSRTREISQMTSRTVKTRENSSNSTRSIKRSEEGSEQQTSESRRNSMYAEKPREAFQMDRNRENSHTSLHATSPLSNIQFDGLSNPKRESYSTQYAEIRQSHAMITNAPRRQSSLQAAVVGSSAASFASHSSVHTSSVRSSPLIQDPERDDFFRSSETGVERLEHQTTMPHSQSDQTVTLPNSESSRTLRNNYETGSILDSSPVKGRTPTALPRFFNATTTGSSQSTSSPSKDRSAAFRDTQEVASIHTPEKQAETIRAPQLSTPVASPSRTLQDKALPEVVDSSNGKERPQVTGKSSRLFGNFLSKGSGPKGSNVLKVKAQKVDSSKENTPKGSNHSKGSTLRVDLPKPKETRKVSKESTRSGKSERSRGFSFSFLGRRTASGGKAEKSDDGGRVLASVGPQPNTPQRGAPQSVPQGSPLKPRVQGNEGELPRNVSVPGGIQYAPTASGQETHYSVVSTQGTQYRPSSAQSPQNHPNSSTRAPLSPLHTSTPASQYLTSASQQPPYSQNTVNSQTSTQLAYTQSSIGHSETNGQYPPPQADATPSGYSTPSAYSNPALLNRPSLGQMQGGEAQSASQHTGRRVSSGQNLYQQATGNMPGVEKRVSVQNLYQQGGVSRNRSGSEGHRGYAENPYRHPPNRYSIQGQVYPPHGYNPAASPPVTQRPPSSSTAGGYSSYSQEGAPYRPSAGGQYPQGAAPYRPSAGGQYPQGAAPPQANGLGHFKYASQPEYVSQGGEEGGEKGVKKVLKTKKMNGLLSTLKAASKGESQDYYYYRQ